MPRRCSSKRPPRRLNRQNLRVYLGGFYLAQGKTVEAEQQLRQALAIDPKHGPALMNLGAMQEKARQTDQAEQTYRQVSALPEQAV